MNTADRFSIIIGIIENLSKLGKPKNGKVPITTGMKEAIWIRYIGDSMKGKCYCCCDSEIKCNSFEAGHIISEKDGGLVEVLNLRPVCKQCNTRMGTQNMREYARQINPDSPLLKE
jgi:5-methylcytosine-specific restriction endonuclease McrA